MASDPISNSQPRPTVNNGAGIDPMAIRQGLQIDDKRARADAVASQLEGVFMDMMMKAMRSTVQEDGLFGKSMGGSNYIEMLDQQYTHLQGIPKDPRFHEVLVKQIMQSPDETSRTLDRINQGNERGGGANVEALGKEIMP